MKVQRKDAMKKNGGRNDRRKGRGIEGLMDKRQERKMEDRRIEGRKETDNRNEKKFSRTVHCSLNKDLGF